jgi:serine protease Do
MKTCLTTAVAFALCACAFPAMSQSKQHTKEKSEPKSEETVVIRERNSGNTTVEIKDGDVYVNGKKMTHGKSDGKNHQKIIIENGSGGSHMRMFDDDDMPMLSSRRAMLGVYTTPGEDVAGAEIDMVSPSSAADKAGLRKGDVIKRIDDIGINNSKQLTELITKHDPGDKVTVTYERNGKTLSTEAALSEAPNQGVARIYKYGPDFKEFEMPNTMGRPFAFDITSELPDASPKMGATVEDLADGNGVRVLGTKPGSPASEAGIQKDDVIKELNGMNIASVDDLQIAIRDVKRNENVKLRFERKGKSSSTNIRFPKATRKKDL